MKFIDLFCGAGGFTEGMKQAGHTPVLGVDVEPICLESYEANHHCDVWEKNVMDIKFMELPKADVIIGSPPCPEYSTMGKHHGKNPNTKFLYKFIEIASNYDKWIGENVPNVRNFLNGIHYKILSANNFGLFHKRDRCFFGKFDKVIKITKNPIIFPTPLAQKGGHNTYIQYSLSRRKKVDAMIRYPPQVSKWIMGFPDEYVILGGKLEQSKQIGNAVCPPVAKAIGDALNEY